MASPWWLIRLADIPWLLSLCCLQRIFCCLHHQLRSFVGWCIGYNPPSVVCGIRLIGLPAPSGRYFIGDCLPFPLAGRPFHRFQPSALDITNVSLPVWVDVSFLLRCQGSRPVPCGTAILHVGGVSSDPKFWIRKPHTNSPAHNNCALATNKHTHTPPKTNTNIFGSY